MTGFAVILLLIAAVFHASWNLVAKKAESKGGGPIFIWIFTLAASIIYTPIVAMMWITGQFKGTFGVAQVAVIFGSAILHHGYYLLLQKAYRVGDLSIVYPIARGIAPLLATAGAVAFFHERPTIIAYIGAALVSVSVFLLAGGNVKRDQAKSTRLAVRYGLLVALMIASYTLWDKRAVSALMIPPLLVDWGANVIRTLMMSPYAFARWSQVKAEWKVNRNNALIIGALSPLTYILVLQALSFTPASYIAPAREVSILVGTAMGARLLQEDGSWRRMAGALTMVIALVALALG